MPWSEWKTEVQGEGGTVPLQESLGAQDEGSSLAPSCHACSHQEVFTENLNTEEFAERGSDGVGGRRLSDEI